MRSKKLLSLILVLCMVLPLLPVFATDSTEPETAGNITYIINHDYDDAADLAAWTKGAVKDETKTVFGLDTTTLTENDTEISALAFSASSIPVGNYVATQPTAFLDFEDVEFTAGNKLIIEMRFKQTGDADGNAYSLLKYNRPNTADIVTSYEDSEGTTVSAPATATAEDASNWWEMLRMQKTEIRSNNNAVASEVDTISNWTDVKIVIDEGTQKYHVFTKTGDVEGTVENDSIATSSKWELQCFDGSVTGYDSLDSLTLYLRSYAQTLYVDYFRVYEATPVYADAQILGGSTVEAGKTADIQFINVSSSSTEIVEAKVGTVPEGAVTINGAAAVQVYNSETQTLSVKPADGFKEGETYTIALNETALSAVGLTCGAKSTKSFTVTGRGARSTGLVINDDFNDGSVSGWVVGNTLDGFAADTLTVVDVPGEEGNKALKFSTTATPAGANGKTANITARIGNGIEYKAGKKIVIKTRVMNTNEDASLVLKYNRPDNVNSLASDDYGHNLYTLFRQNNASNKTTTTDPDTGEEVTTFKQQISFNGGVVQTNASDTNTQQGSLNAITGSSGIYPPNNVNKWVEYEITLNGVQDDGTTNSYTITAKVADDNGELKPYSKTGTMLQPNRVYEKEFGSGTTKRHFDALDRLTFYFMNNASTAYIDYIQVYESDAVVDVEVKDTIRYDEAFKIEFNTTGALENVDGIVSVEGLEGAEQRYDAATKTLTIIPAENLTAGSTYNVSIDKNALAELGLLYEGDASYTVKIRDNVILHDTFENGNWGNWKIGAIKNPSDSYTYAVEDGVLKLETAATLNNNFCDQPNLVNDFADVDFSADRNIIIEAKIKQTGNGASPNKGISYLKYNRPDKTDFKGDHTQEEMGSHWYTLVRFDTDKLQHQHISNSFGTTAFAENEDFTNQWIDIKVIINGADKTYTVTATTENGGNYEGASKLYTAPNAYTCAGVDPNKGFTSLNSLTFMLREYVNKLHIDEIKVYEDEISDIYAIMPEGNTVEAGDSIDFTFYGKDVIDSIPAGAVKIDGANATYTAFADNTLSIKPASGEFESTGTYTVTIDAEALESAGMNYIGQTSFTVTGRGAREITGISDNFAGDKDDWYVGASADGYLATATPVTDSGAKDGNALKIEFPARGTTADSQYGNVTKKLGNGIAFKDGEKVVIETRVKKTSDDGYFAIKLNRPDMEEQLKEDIAWPSQYALLISYPDTDANSRGAQISQGIFPDESAGATYNCPRLLSLPDTGDFDFVNKWVTYKMVLDYEKKKIYTTVTYTDGDKEVTLVDNNTQGEMMAARWDLDAIHGKGAFDILEDKYYTSLDRITFTSINDCDIYVDYVNVYTTTSIDEKISAKLTTDGVNGVDSFVEGDTVKPVFELQPKDGAETTYYAISAKYVDGKLADKHIEKITTTGKTHTDETGYTIGNEGNVVIKAFVWSESFVPLCTSAEAESEVYTVYVRTSGDDNATGASDAPVASLEKALELVYAATTNEGIEDAEIIVGGGNYKVASTIEIPKNAAIPANGLTIKNAEGEEAIFVGGNTYTGNDMVKVTAENDTYGVLSKVPAADKLYMIRLADINEVPALSYPGPTAYRVDIALEGLGIETPSKVTAEAAFDGALMTVARWPNTGYSKTTSGSSTVQAKNLLKGYDDAADIAALSADAKAALKTNIETGITVGVDSSKDISKWANAKDALMFGYWEYDWATQTMPVGAVDAANHTITSKYAGYYSAKANSRFYIYNLLEELDTDGEYYIDREHKVMYFCKDTAPTAENKVTLSLLEEAMLKIWAPNITIDGLIFESSRGTGVALSATDYVTVQNCTMRNLGSFGVSVYAKNCNVLNNNIYDTNGGIVVGNEDATNDPKNLTLANNLIHGNTIKRFSRLDKVYVDGILLGGIGNTASYNHISEGEHLAVRVTGNFNTFKYNEITNVLNETDDAGAIYMGRSWTQRGNKILSNYIHDLAMNNNEVGAGDSPVAGIFLDDHYAGAYVEGNVFANIKGHGVRTNRGRENTITNNLFVNCTNGGAAVASNLAAQDNLTTDNDFSTQYNNTKNDYMQTGVWYEKFPEIRDTLLMDWAKPEKNVVTNNYTVKCGGTGIAVGAWPTSLGTVSGNDSVAADSEIEAGAYGVDAAKTGITGFKTIDFANMRK